ncbi:hypothetical protein FRC02_005798 [Tulasnella sp. 418]|nr:hypothetical protein FRC02_005798 [Tulasnella sp. 418]
MSTTGKEIETNPRGIPRAPFIEDVQAHVGGPDAEVESTLRQFQQAIAKYRYMELNLNQKKKGLLEKIPDVGKTLSMVKYLKSRRSSKDEASKGDDLDEGDAASKPLTTTFELNDTLYAEAEVVENDTVYLWLGVSFSISNETKSERVGVAYRSNRLM